MIYINIYMWHLGCPKACVPLLVVGVRYQDGWLKDPRYPRAGVDLLVGGLDPNMAGCRAATVLGLMSACWW